jgi:transposase InsO family protein
MSTSLSRFFKVIGISKQAFHQRMNRRLVEHSYEHQLLHLIHQLRGEHPTMGCRDMYFKLCPEHMGRDRFEQFCMLHGLASKPIRNFAKTTDSSGVVKFENLTENLVLCGLNQLWVSDITYFEVNGRFYYLTFITDAYSRRILGHVASKRLFTEQTSLPALQQAIASRKGMNLKGLIFHSDGGGQYYDKGFLKMTEDHEFRNSMCDYAWENGKAERVNGVIKNNYLKHWNIKSFEELTRELDRSVQLYNEDKPHSSLKRLTPVTFENRYLANGKAFDGDKSTTEYEMLQPQGMNNPAGCGKAFLGSNITLEYV